MLKKQFANKNFIKFIFLGGIAAGVNFFSRILLGYFLSYTMSIIVAYLLGMVTAYLLYRFYVFTSTANTPAKEIFYFSLINILSIIQVVVVSIAFDDYLLIFISDVFIRQEIAHFVGIAVPVFTSYLGHKYFSFK